MDEIITHVQIESKYRTGKSWWVLGGSSAVALDGRRLVQRHGGGGGRRRSGVVGPRLASAGAEGQIQDGAQHVETGADVEHHGPLALRSLMARKKNIHQKQDDRKAEWQVGKFD